LSVSPADWENLDSTGAIIVICNTVKDVEGTLSRSQFFICREFSDEAAETQSPQARKVLLTLLKKGEHEVERHN
ncbi:hypothetical protein U0070_019676, partial [Myodes glareolus]